MYNIFDTASPKRIMYEAQIFLGNTVDTLSFKVSNSC